MPILAGGLLVLAGGLPVLAGGLPVTAGYRQKNASRLNRQHNCSCVQWVYLPVKSRHMLVFASEEQYGIHLALASFTLAHSLTQHSLRSQGPTYIGFQQSSTKHPATMSDR